MFAGESVELWSSPPGLGDAAFVGALPVTPGDRFRLLAIEAGPEDSNQSSAEGYQVWYQILVAGGERAWVQAAVPSSMDTGSDGRPSGVVYALLLDASAS